MGSCIWECVHFSPQATLLRNLSNNSGQEQSSAAAQFLKPQKTEEHWLQRENCILPFERVSGQGEAPTCTRIALWHPGTEAAAETEPRKTHLLEFQREKGDLQQKPILLLGRHFCKPICGAEDLPKVMAQKATSITQKEKVCTGET